MTEEWKSFTDDAKKPYHDLSQKEKDRYEREMREYKEKLAKEAAVSGDKEDKLAGKKRPATATPQKGKGKAPEAPAAIDKKVKKPAEKKEVPAKPVKKPVEAPKPKEEGKISVS